MVKLATVYSIGLHELPPYVTRFMKAHPRVKVHVEYSRTDRICDACIDDSIEFGIVAIPVRRSQVSVLPWHEEKLVLVCPPGHRLARRRRVSLTALAGEPFIAFEPDIPTRRTIDRILRSHRVAVRTLMEFDNVETIKRSVEVGSGLSILPETTLVSEVASGQLAAIDFTEGPFTRRGRRGPPPRQGARRRGPRVHRDAGHPDLTSRRVGWAEPRPTAPNTSGGAEAAPYIPG